MMQLGGARVAVCEGDSHGFAAKFFKKGDVKVAAFKAGGCLGTSSFIGKNKSEDSDAAMTWPSQMPQARSSPQAPMLHESHCVTQDGFACQNATPTCNLSGLRN